MGVILTAIDFPVGKWMSYNITLWGIFLCCFAACNSFAGLAVLRLGLGMCEGAITAGFMIITSMVSLEFQIWLARPNKVMIVLHSC